MINKYISVIYRLSQIYFDEKLFSYNISCGQQFFLLRIYENPGISVMELSLLDCFDKGTTARAVKKLEEEGYIKREENINDKRANKLFLTKKAYAVIDFIKSMLVDWNNEITKDLTEQEKEIVNDIVEKMAKNAYLFIDKNRRRNK